MLELVREEARDLAIGTWIGVALIVEVLINQYDIPREELLLLLGAAETAATGAKKTAIAGLRLLIERGFG